MEGRRQGRAVVGPEAHGPEGLLCKDAQGQRQGREMAGPESHTTAASPPQAEELL